MATVTAFEAKTRFGELLERVSRGEEVVITRHGMTTSVAAFKACATCSSEFGGALEGQAYG